MARLSRPNFELRGNWTYFFHFEVFCIFDNLIKVNKIISKRANRKKRPKIRIKKNPRKETPQGKNPHGNKPPLDCQKDVKLIKLN